MTDLRDLRVIATLNVFEGETGESCGEGDLTSSHPG